MGNIVDTVKNEVQNSILTANDTNITPKIKFAIRSINASSVENGTSFMARSECGQLIGFLPF